MSPNGARPTRGQPRSNSLASRSKPSPAKASTRRHAPDHTITPPATSPPGFMRAVRVGAATQLQHAITEVRVGDGAQPAACLL